MTENAAGATIAPPYVSFLTVLSLFERLHETGVPEHIERDVMGTIMNGSVYGHLKTSLKFLGLIGDHGKTTDELEKLASANTDERKKIMRQLIESRYTFLFGSEAKDIDVTRTTQPKLRKAFEERGIKPNVAKKCISFFLQAASYTGIPLSKYLYTPKQPTRQYRPGRTGHADKPKQPGNAATRGSVNSEPPSPESKDLEAQIDSFIKLLAAQPADEKLRLFERVKLAIHYAELYSQEK